LTTVIRADRLIDGTGAAPTDDAVLVVGGEKIVGVFRHNAPDGLLPDGAETLDFRGCTILPGLIDTHVHLNLPGDGTTLEVVVREPDGVLVATSAFNAARALAAGITTVRDVGGARGTVFELRRALELGHGSGARILACGQPITITGGHTWYFGGEADGEDALRRKVREMAKLGADFIKVMASGGGTVNTQSWRPSYSRAELAALADEAHHMGRRITAHCLCAQATEWAVDAGFDGIEHASFLVNREGRQEYVPAIADKVARAGVPVTSTLAVGGFMLKTMHAIEHPTPAEQAVLDRWLRMFDDNLSQFRRMREAGVEWVAGTDAGWRFTPIEGLPLELELMQQGGFSALEAITAATGLAARVLGVEEKLGTLKPGLAADVIVVAGNPLDDLSRLADIRLVMQGGKVRVQRAS
jgi:imidazolonepropionase-like amidohydrolase